MTTETLEYETPHFLQSLFAGDLGLLKALEKETGTRITTRDGWIRFHGHAAGVAAGKHVFAQLEKARRRGTDINEHFFRFAMENARDGEPADGVDRDPQPSRPAAAQPSLDDLTGIKIAGSPRKRCRRTT